MKKIKINLSHQIFISLILGVVSGIIINKNIKLENCILANFIYLICEIFLRIIKMLIIPIVVTTLILSISKIGNIRKIGSLGLKTIIYFEFMTFLAIIVGITFANFLKPGYEIEILQTKNIEIFNKLYQNNIEINKYDSLRSLSSIVPTNIFDAFYKNNILQIIFFSIVFGIGLSNVENKFKENLTNTLQSISTTMFEITNIVIKYSPIGIFSLTFITVSSLGINSLLPVIKLIYTVYLAILFFTLVILGTVAKIFNINIFKIILLIKEELILSFSTASSESVLPKIIKKIETYGVSKKITNFVIPIGYSFNLDGSTLYQSIATIFIAQIYKIELSYTQEITLFLTLMITSKGLAGIPGISLITLVTVLENIGLPIEGIVFIAGVDRILDMARTSLNVIGNVLATLIIERIENKFNKKIFKKRKK